ADAPGISRTRTFMVDSRNAARIRFDGVKLNGENVLGEADNGFALLDRVLDRARIGLSAEMLGSAQGAFDMTLAYLKERTQFGAPIGRFQALQHRAAVMFAELELLRSVILEASSAVDENANTVPLLASLAKARASDTFHLTAREAIQMHGGIGMTDEHDIGFYLKRCAAAEAAFGGPAFHRNRYAALEGF
ncbi:MAG: acyl-CoA dehydrogenase family protein, partial [Alphaproteobacteria bacterium]